MSQSAARGEQQEPAGAPKVGGGGGGGGHAGGAGGGRAGGAGGGHAGGGGGGRAGGAASEGTTSPAELTSPRSLAGPTGDAEVSADLRHPDPIAVLPSTPAIPSPAASPVPDALPRSAAIPAPSRRPPSTTRPRARLLRPLPSKLQTWWRAFPRWERRALALILTFSAAMYGWEAAHASYHGFYAVAVKSMTTGWRAFLFGALDPNASITIDKIPGFLWPQATSALVFGFHPWSLALPQAVEGLVTVLALHARTPR